MMVEASLNSILCLIGVKPISGLTSNKRMRRFTRYTLRATPALAASLAPVKSRKAKIFALDAGGGYKAIAKNVAYMSTNNELAI